MISTETSSSGAVSHCLPVPVNSRSILIPSKFSSTCIRMRQCCLLENQWEDQSWSPIRVNLTVWFIINQICVVPVKPWTTCTASWDQFHPNLIHVEDESTPRSNSKKRGSRRISCHTLDNFHQKKRPFSTQWPQRTSFYNQDSLPFINEPRARAWDVHPKSTLSLSRLREGIDRRALAWREALVHIDDPLPELICFAIDTSSFEHIELPAKLLYYF
jgi:hypothetical protein